MYLKSLLLPTSFCLLHTPKSSPHSLPSTSCACSQTPPYPSHTPLASHAYGIISRRKTYIFPKGPIGLPFLGNVQQIVDRPHLKLSEWAKSHGKLYTIYLGSSPVLLVNDATLMKELFSTYASSGKFRNDTTLLQSMGPYGIFNTEGKESTVERQFFHKALRNFGFSNKQEALILEEAEELCRWISAKMSEKGNVIMNDVLKKAANNALWTIVSGERVHYHDTRVADLMENWVTTFQRTYATGLGFMPWLKYVAPKWSGYTEYYKACDNIHEFVKEKFLEHRPTLIKGSPRDLLDFYEERLLAAERKDKELVWKNNVATIQNLFIAGGETTASTLNWLIFNLLQNSNVQRKMHIEIDEVVGTSRQPMLADKVRMPYVEEVILETLRHSALAPIGVPHQLLEDLQFQEYYLPKGMILIANIYHCLRDPKVWENPEEFRPERFLNSDSKINEANKRHLVAFQAGRRICIGETLAKDVLFLFVTKLFQNFEAVPDSTLELEEYAKPNIGGMLLPRALNVIMRSRQVEL